MTVKIATWNLERPKQPKTRSEKNRLLLDRLKEQDADIFVLTETNTCIDLGPEYESHPSADAESAGRMTYKEGEKRVTIWVKRKFGPARSQITRDPASSVCVALQTDQGQLQIYGTVLGALGWPTKDDLDRQIADWEDFGRSKNICIAGDFNTSFIDNYRVKHEARNRILESFKNLAIDNLTLNKRECIDHIAISMSYFASAIPKVHEWNQDKQNAVPKLSDHKGICVSLNFQNKSN